jgi:hypothetical protein
MFPAGNVASRLLALLNHRMDKVELRPPESNMSLLHISPHAAHGMRGLGKNPQVHGLPLSDQLLTGSILHVLPQMSFHTFKSLSYITL